MANTDNGQARDIAQLRSMLSRRRFLGAAGAIGAGVALGGSLAACGTKSDKRSYAFPKDVSDAEKVVRWQTGRCT